MIHRAPILGFGMLLLLMWCAGQELVGSSWEAADQLFRQDSRWLGGDGAHSVDLGNGRVLWLFADSWIGLGARTTRRKARLVSNTIAIQRGYDPSSARIEFHWSRGGDGGAAPFFEPPGGGRLWPGHGLRLGEQLLLFMMRVRSIDRDPGFEIYDWAAVMVANPDAPPSRWKLQWLETPRVRSQIIVGSGVVTYKSGFVYAFSAQESTASHSIYLARWAAEDARAGRLNDLEWWCGAAGWLSDTSPATRPEPILTDGQTEFTVHYDVVSGRYLQVQTVGFGAAMIVFRSASQITGPWTQPIIAYRPPEHIRPGVLIYAAKAHPELRGADLVVTYATNHLDFAQQVGDNSLYYPRFVRFTRQEK